MIEYSLNTALYVSLIKHIYINVITLFKQWLQYQSKSQFYIIV